MASSPTLPGAADAEPAGAAALAAEAEGVAFSYGERPALDGLTLRVPVGAAFGLLGPNGCGKSSFLSLLLGFQQPRLGWVRVLGAPPSARTRAQVGVVFQESCLDPLMTAAETLWLHGRLFGLGAGDLRRKVPAFLEAVGLQERAGSPTHTLSGGMRRRLELARALLPESRLLLLDEPTVGLDPDSRQALWEHLTAAVGRGTTLILATNEVVEAERHCTEVAFLAGGRCVAQGTPAALKRGLKRDAVRVEWPGATAQDAAAIAAWPGVGGVALAPPTLHVTVDDAAAFVPRLFRFARDGVHTLHVDRSTLEDAYFRLVGAPLSGRQGAPR